MKPTLSVRTGFLFLALLVTLLIAAPHRAGAQYLARITGVTNQVIARNTVTGNAVVGRVGVLLVAGDSIRTGARSAAIVTFNDNSALRLGELTEITIRPAHFNDTQVSSGSVFGTFKGPGRVSGRYGVAAVRGTKIGVFVLNGHDTFSDYPDGAGSHLVDVAKSSTQLLSLNITTINGNQVQAAGLIGDKENWVGALFIVDVAGTPQTFHITNFDPTTGTLTLDAAPGADIRPGDAFTLVLPADANIVTLQPGQESSVDSNPDSFPSTPQSTPGESFAGGNENPSFFGVDDGQNSQNYTQGPFYEDFRMDYLELFHAAQSGTPTGGGAPGFQPGPNPGGNSVGTTVPGTAGSGGTGSQVPGSGGAGGVGTTTPGSGSAGGGGTSIPGSGGAGGAGTTVPGSGGAGGAGTKVPGSGGAGGTGVAVPGSGGAGGTGTSIPGSTGAGSGGVKVPGSGGSGGVWISAPGSSSGGVNIRVPGAGGTGGIAIKVPAGAGVGGAGGSIPGSAGAGGVGVTVPGGGGAGGVKVGVPGSGGTGGVGVTVPGSGGTGGVGVTVPGSGGTGGVGVTVPGSGGSGGVNVGVPGSGGTGGVGVTLPGAGTGNVGVTVPGAGVGNVGVTVPGAGVGNVGVTVPGAGVGNANVIVPPASNGGQLQVIVGRLYRAEGVLANSGGRAPTFVPNRAQFDADGYDGEGSGSVLGHSRYTATLGDIFFGAGVRVGKLNNRSDVTVDEAMIRYRQQSVGDIKIGRFQWFPGPVFSDNLGRLISFDTADGILWRLPVPGPVSVQTAILPHIDPLSGPGTSAYVARLGTRLQTIRLGATAVMGSVAPGRVGYSMDASAPVVPQILEVYGEIGQDLLHQALYTTGIYLPYMFNRFRTDVYLEYSHRQNYGGEADLFARFPVNRGFNGLVTLRKFGARAWQPGLGLQLRY